MVEYVYLQKLSGSNEVAGDLNVGLRRRGVAAGMIMHQHERGGVGGDGFLKNLARVNNGGVEGAAGDLLALEQAAATTAAM